MKSMKEKRTCKKLRDGNYEITAHETQVYTHEEAQAIYFSLLGQKKTKENEIANMKLMIPMGEQQIKQLETQLKWLRKNIPKITILPEKKVEINSKEKLT